MASIILSLNGLGTVLFVFERGVNIQLLCFDGCGALLAKEISVYVPSKECITLVDAIVSIPHSGCLWDASIRNELYVPVLGIETIQAD